MATTINRVDPAENEFLSSLESKTKQPNPFLRAMANRPEALKNFIPFYGALVGPGSVDRRIKTIALPGRLLRQPVRLLYRRQPPRRPQSGTHRRPGLRALENWQEEGFSPAERAAIRYARELTRPPRSHFAREEMFQHFTHEQIVEITLVIAMANFTNRFNNGLEI